MKVDQRRFFPTELGELVEKIMVGKFPEIFNVEFTSGMESELDRIEDGELLWQGVLKDFYTPFSKALEAVDLNALVADAHGLKPEDLAKERCPKCGSAIELKTGRFGPYLACVKYKDTCDYVKSLRKGRAPDRPTDEKCQLCGSPMVIKTGRFGEFLACTTYPACKGTRAISLGIKCPKCLEGDLAERRTKRGKSFWGCVRYPACDFSTWNRPVPDTCAECGWIGMEKKIEQGGGRDPHLPQVRQQGGRRRARGGGAGVTSATVVGGGLAGSEAAWALAERGVRVTLYEMRPAGADAGASHRPARPSSSAATPSSPSNSPTPTACSRPSCGHSGSLLLPCADLARVPGGTALAVDREIFSQAVHRAGHRRIPTSRWCDEEAAGLPSPGVVATGPLTSARLATEAIVARLGSAALAFYDAIAPVVSVDSLDHDRLYALSRYGKGEGDDYLNARSMDAAAYERFLDALIEADQHQGHDFDQVPYFEGCLPVEEMARRGRETLRFGPMKPVGLPDPRTGREPHAVVQLRREDRAGQMWNLVGFQTRLRIPEQQRVFRLIPGLEQAEYLRFGSIHRNSYLNSPASLGPALTARDDDALFFAGQLTGVEGYTESLGTGLLAGINLARRLEGLSALVPPPDHDARRPLPLPPRGGSQALPADERQLRAARAAAGEGEEGPQEGAAGRAGAGRSSGGFWESSDEKPSSPST